MKNALLCLLTAAMLFGSFACTTQPLEDIEAPTAAPTDAPTDCDTYDHYGITYVMPAAAIAAAGKSVTVSADGLIVISSASVEDTDVLTTLYRALM